MEIVKKLGQFLKQVGFKENELSFIPCSGLSGANLKERATDERLQWYKGPTLLEQIGNGNSALTSISLATFPSVVMIIFASVKNDSVLQYSDFKISAMTQPLFCNISALNLKRSYIFGRKH